MKKKFLVPFSAVVIGCAICLGIYFGKENAKPYSIGMGILDPDFDYSIDAILEDADLVAVVKIIDNEYPVGSNHFVKASVEDTLMGTAVSDEILIPVEAPVLENKEYLLFLRLRNSYAYPENAYVPSHSGAFYKIGLFGRLHSFSQLGDITIDGLPTLGRVGSYIEENAPLMPLNLDETVPDSFASVAEAIAYADRAAKIEITAVDDSHSATYIAEYDITELYKGESWSENEGNFLPKIPEGLEIGKEYIVLFKEDADGILMPVSREGSLLISGTDDFAEAENYFSDAQ